MARDWQFWALGSATFAALTAILGKLGVETLNSDLATLVRTGVVIALLAIIVAISGAWREIGAISGRCLGYLTLSGLATGASWLCYFRALKLGPVARVAPIDKMSVVLVAVFSVFFLHERLAGTSWLGIGLIATGAVLLALRN